MLSSILAITPEKLQAVVPLSILVPSITHPDTAPVTHTFKVTALEGLAAAAAAVTSNKGS